MKQYLNILRNIVENGQDKKPVRFDDQGNIVPVENETIGTFCEIFRHQMSDGFPLLTTKKVPIKSTAAELEFFIKGLTSKQWLKDRGCKFWNEWCNPQKLVGMTFESYQDKKKAQLEEDDLGPCVYGASWRNFRDPENEDETNTFDQLKSIVDKLHENPYDRRMICSAWNPIGLNYTALPACHLLFNVVVYGNTLNLLWLQRSCDVPYGVPVNIASYALLLKLLAKEGNLKEGELVGVLADAHIYKNQLDGVLEQLKREPTQLPSLHIPDENWKGIFEWTYKDIIVENYKPQTRIDFGKITV